MTRGPLLHADADAFFASVALRTRPELTAVPVVVVAHVIVTCPNYPARARGVRAGMLVDQARHLCPELVVLGLPHEEIEQVGDALFDLFGEFSPAVEPGSIEEAFLDTSHLDWAAATQVGRLLRQRVAAELGLPLTVGVGRTKLMAKLASRAGKPDGLHVIDAGREAQLRTELTIADLWGVGGRTASRLRELGISRLLDLDRISRADLQRSCGTTMANRLRRIREGTDDAEVRPTRDRTAFSSEGSIEGYARPPYLPSELLALCVERVCRRADRAGLAASKLLVTLRPVNPEAGQALVRRQTVAEATSSPVTWLAVAGELLASLPVPDLTTVSVTLTDLVPADQVQGALF